MSEQIQLIASRIKALREISDMTLEQLAQAIDTPVEQCNQYESGTVDIPISHLYALSNLFKVETSVLLTGEDPHLHIYSLVRSGQGVRVNRRLDYNYVSLAHTFRDKLAEPFLVTAEPVAAGTPINLHSHAKQELDYVIEGCLKVVIYDREIILHAGDALYFDSNYPHGMQAVGDQPVTWLAVVL